MRVFIIDCAVPPSHTDTLFLATALGARIVYTTSQLDHARVRGELLVAGLPLLPIVTVPATHTVHDVRAWLAMQRKCVFVDATLDTLTMPLLAFPEVDHFVLVNWQARALEPVAIKQVLGGCGLRLAHVDAAMLRFVSSQHKVVDVYMNVECITDISDKLSGFTDIFVTERLPGPVLTGGGAVRVQVGSTTNATFQTDKWMDSIVNGYVLLNNAMQPHRFTDFETYKHHRDSLVHKAVVQ